ncbi:MAG: CBS domain-containing protein [Alphaproteobacteria bacterium]|nr:CBS domain-containing protein [Alphaproteobacteria bacterium]
MSVAHILNEKGREVITAKPTSTLLEIAKLLAEHRIGAVLIVNDEGATQGIVSERDIVREISINGIQAMDMHADKIMTTNLHTARIEDSEIELMALMTQRRIRHVPVIHEGRLAGMVSIGDVVKQRIKEIEREAAEMKAYIATAY